MQPLDGIRVIDLTRVLSGPFCTMTLADLGAEVIKIEPPSGDDTRHWGPPFIKGESTYFLSANRSKKSVVLDLKTDIGTQALWDLIGTADIVVENFRPLTLDRLGFSWEQIHHLAPRVILVSISGYGHTGPLAASPGYDLIAQGEGGLMYVTGEPGRPPVKVGFSIADIGTGMWAVIGILSVLRNREQNGLGDHVDVSLLETVVSWQTYHAEASLMAGEVPQPLGSAHPTIAPYQSFTASDGYFNLAVGNDGHWNRFCDVLDSVCETDRWYRDEAYAHNPDRVRVREALADRLNAIFCQRPRSEWLHLFAEAGIPGGSVNTIAEALVHPQIQARALVQTIVHPTLGAMPTVKMPITFAHAETRTPSPPPLLGADTSDVLQSLGYPRPEP
jgi:crotonobetainyl-CoA:carnitine CoA-transferase CaiB-like acyl-CoA transferase